MTRSTGTWLMGSIEQDGAAQGGCWREATEDDEVQGEF